MNRGSQGTQLGTERSAVRFNEAPIHESGKYHDLRPESDRTDRFNEAPIHESGKVRPRGPIPRTACGFNEAPIHESGKFGV